MTIPSIPIGVWIAIGIAFIAALWFVMGGITTAILFTGDWINHRDLDGDIQILVVLTWPIILPCLLGWLIGIWLSTPAPPKPIPLPDEIKEKSCK